jgi:hypothetical protein
MRRLAKDEMNYPIRKTSFPIKHTKKTLIERAFTDTANERQNIFCFHHCLSKELKANVFTQFSLSLFFLVIIARNSVRKSGEYADNQ